jgi:hypothetical protein
MLQWTSSNLAANAIRDKDNKIVWFNMSETKFKKELQNMQNKYLEIIRKKEAKMWKTEQNTIESSTWKKYTW